MVAEIRIDGGTAYPIFCLPQDDENLADTISTREQEPPFRTMVRLAGGAGGARTHDRRIMSPLL